MSVPFIRRVFGKDADPDLNLAFDDNGQMTRESVARIKSAAGRGDAVAMANYGTALLARGDRTGALVWLTRAWEAGNVVAGFNLGTLHQGAGDLNRAQVVWEKSAELGDADAMLGLIRQALERGEVATTERWIRAVYTQDDAFPITAMGCAFAQHGHIPQAIRAFRRAVDLGDGYAMGYLAQIFDEQGEHEEAEALRERAKTAERML